jgi:hypothetical protein
MERAHCLRDDARDEHQVDGLRTLLRALQDPPPQPGGSLDLYPPEPHTRQLVADRDVVVTLRDASVVRT